MVQKDLKWFESSVVDALGRISIKVQKEKDEMDGLSSNIDDRIDGRIADYLSNLSLEESDPIALAVDDDIIYRLENVLADLNNN